MNLELFNLVDLCLQIIYIKYIGYIHGTHMSVDNSTNNVMFFFVSDLKTVFETTINPQSQCFG